jgi:rhodanese-related sulfurtransferase
MAHNDIKITPETLRENLENHENILILDVRPLDQRQEWQIPGSVHLDVYQSLREGDFSGIQAVEIPPGKQVVIVCAAGRTSKVAAGALRSKGVEAYSLEGGMKAWSLAWNKAIISDGKLTIIQLRRTGKGCLSYLVGSGTEAFVIDASLNTDIYESLAKKHGWTIKYVADTHIHADHLSRSFHLAESTGAELFMPAQNKLKYDFHAIEDQSELSIGGATFKGTYCRKHVLSHKSKISFYRRHLVYRWSRKTRFKGQRRRGKRKGVTSLPILTKTNCAS